MSQPKRRRRVPGYTLIELLVAGLISSLVLIAVYVVFIANTDQYYRQEQIVQMQEGMRFAVEYLKNDLRNVGRQSVANGIAPGAPPADPGYCGPPEQRGARLFDNEGAGVPAVLRGHGNGLRPDRLRLMVDASGGTPLAVGRVSGATVSIVGPDAQLSADGRALLQEESESTFEAAYKSGYFLRVSSNTHFTVVPISEVDFGDGSPVITASGPINCPADPTFCRAGGCLANPVQLVEYRIVEDEEQADALKTDLVRQVIHSVEDEPIDGETVIVAEYIVNLQLWGTYDTRANSPDKPLIPNDADPKDDIGNWGGDDEADRFNTRPERLRQLNVLLARRTSREDKEFRVAPGAADAPDDRVAADLTWFDLDGDGAPDRTSGLARVATLQAGVETPNMVTGL